MQHMVAFYESIDPAGTLSKIAAVQDDTITTNSDDVRVPADLPYLIGEVALTAAASFVRAQVQSPSLRYIANLDIEPVVNAVTFGSPPEIMMHPLSPVPVTPRESVNMLLQSTPAAGAEAHYGLLVFADGAQEPVTGEIYTVRCTGAAVLSAGVWVNSNLTFGQSLPVGTYNVVGFRARGANLVAARLNFVGKSFRPGVPAVNAIGDLDPRICRYGHMGVLGSFDSETPPTVDCLGITDTSQVFELDLIKVG